jgi:hypothetical protein
MTISLCIISYDKDYHLIYDLLEEFKKQTIPPSEIIFYCSGIEFVKNIPDYINISSQKIPIYTIFSKKRTNQAKARNICSKTAFADYIMFFDIDDIPHPMKIEITEQILLNNKNTKFLLHNYNQVSSKQYVSHDIIGDDVEIYPIDTIDEKSTNVVCGNHPIHHAHITIDYEIASNLFFNESMEFYRKEDSKFCQDLVINRYDGLYCPLKLVNYII